MGADGINMGLDIIERTFVIREMKRPKSIALARKSLVRWFALAVGLANPNDKRDTAIRIIDKIIEINFSNGKPAKTSEISKETGIEERLVNYHISRMREIGIIDKKGGGYFVHTNFEGEPSLENLRSAVNQSLSRTETVLKEIIRMV